MTMLAQFILDCFPDAIADYGLLGCLGAVLTVLSIGCLIICLIADLSNRD